MNDLLPDPPRWKERFDQTHVAEREAGRVIRVMRAPEPLPAAQLVRIAARIRVERPRRRTFWLAATAALLLGGATVASAAHLNVLPGWLTRIVRLQPAGPVPHKHASLGRPTRMPAAEAAAVANAPTVPKANALPAAIPSTPEQPAGTIGDGDSMGSDLAPLPSRKVVRKAIEVVPVENAPRMPARDARPSPPIPSSLEPAPAVTMPSEAQRVRGAQVAWLEKPAQPDPASPARMVEDPRPALEAGSAQGAAKVLSEAIHALRVEHSPGTALFLLDRHGTQLGKSAFAHEALLLRVEAMLALGRKGEVLRLLDGAALTDVAASRSLLVTRGELRASANRCADALGDFNLVLARSKQADRQALLGRSVCRKKLGDSAGAQTDIERYRREFATDPRLSDLERQAGVLK